MSEKKTPRSPNRNSGNRKKSVSEELVVEKFSELSEQIKDVKKNVESVETLAISSDKTLAVQAQQLAEHMRRTDALEELVEINKKQLEKNDEKLFDEQKELIGKVTEVSVNITSIKNFVGWSVAGIGLVVSIVQLALKFMVK